MKEKKLKNSKKIHKCLNNHSNNLYLLNNNNLIHHNHFHHPHNHSHNMFKVHLKFETDPALYEQIS